MRDILKIRITSNASNASYSMLYQFKLEGEAMCVYNGIIVFTYYIIICSPSLLGNPRCMHANPNKVGSEDSPSSRTVYKKNATAAAPAPTSVWTARPAAAFGVVEVATAPAEPVEVCDPEAVFELPEAAALVPPPDSEAPKADPEIEDEEPEAED